MLKMFSRSKVIAKPKPEVDATLLAVEALDELSFKLLKASELGGPPGFLDWIAYEATPLVQAYVECSLDKPKFARSLQLGDPKIAMAHWVRHWVSPGITNRFGQMAVHL
jgi:hypothetical protein